MSHGRQREYAETRGAGFVFFLGILLLAAAAVYVMSLTQSFRFDPPRFEELRELPGELASWFSWEPGSSVLRLPWPDRSYTVQAGDTLSIIAGRHGVELSDLVARNRIRDPDALRVGQVLTIPAGAGSARGAGSVSDAESHGLTAALQRQLRSWFGDSESDDDKVQSPSAAAPPPPAQDASLRAIDELLAMAEAELRAARFDDGLHTALAASRILEVHPDAPDSESRRARLEVVRATAYTALGNFEEARQSFGRALEADPALELDPAQTSPKVLRQLEAARSSRS